MPKFVPRERKHKRLARNKSSDPQAAAGSGIHQANQEEIVPLSKTEREERKRKLKEEIHGPEKVSGKKKKRLDKYIETKLKKEENLELLKKLAAQKVDTSLLQSSKKLGRVSESKKEKLQRALSERQAGLDIQGDQDAILFEQRPPHSPHSSSDVPDAEHELSDGNAAETVPAVKPTTSFGSGLKRPLETDASGQPLIKKRKRQKKPSAIQFSAHRVPEALPSELQEEEVESGDEWNGFDSDIGREPELDSENEELDSMSQDSKGSEDLDEDWGSELEVMDNESTEDDEELGDKPERVSAFKAWADTQRNEAVGFTPSALPADDKAARASFKPRAPSPDPLATEIAKTSKGDSYRPAAAVTIPRSDEVQATRLELPVVQDEQRIMEAIHNNPVTVVCGATGSGKTTQLPQMLLENGYASTGMIGITQPRRVAATSVASRVAHELGNEYGKKVAHQVRYDTNVGRDTKIKFMTDGILLREISQDFALSKYSAVVIDEAHERSVNTDILIGMLSRIVPLRQELSLEDPKKHHPLKLIIMSATLRVTDFIMNQRLFKSTKPPIVQAEGRQFPVTEHFARRTQRDYVAETVHKVARGHAKLPPGGILVFLTGQDEIQTVESRLKEAFAVQSTGFQNSRHLGKTPRNDYIEEEEPGDDSDSEVEITGLDEDDAEDAEFEVEVDPSLPQRSGVLKPHILSLYAALPTNQQMKVFERPPEGSRPIILATNVAETSLTIPGIRYVFDCGRSKEKQYDTSTGVQEFRIDWISKASASQRAGRAGRTGPGHCYRLYSSAIYEQYFEEHSLPEILRTPIEGTVLQLKSMDVDNVVNFPFPTPPQREQLAQAERLLKNLGAIDAKLGRVTDIGKELIHYPVNPRFGKMLLLGARNKVIAHTIALVAGLAVGDLFIPETQFAQSISAGGTEAQPSEFSDENSAKAKNSGLSEAASKQKQAYGRAQATLSAWDDKSDAIKLLTAVAAHAQEANDSKSFCAKYFVRQKGMDEVQQLRRQLHSIVQNHIKHGIDTSYKLVLSPPSREQISILKQIVAAGYIDQVAVRADLLPSAVSTGRKPRRAIEVPYRTLMPSITEAEIDRTASPEDQAQLRSAFIHSGSVLSKLSVAEMPPYIVYANLSRATANVEGEKKRVRLHPLTTVGPKQLGALADGTPLLEVGKPIGKIEEKDGGKRRECWVSMALRDPNAVGTIGWPLGAWKVVQSRKAKDWAIEKVIDRGR
ncbi:related to DEAH-box RNA helicase (Dhr1) [Lecanosticta acicola]|uniref:RNA helicase n=1 Tax=Lecanosticta acicola TaxID=111012 RepID=A0AAI8Z0I2_9PEZI|nr:related to DEAH-box RNA helicase (Dhr1) [Lecanosticta acicola]